VFKFFARFASRKPTDPLQLALRALELGDFDAAESGLTALLAQAQSPVDRALLLNKLGVTRVRTGRRDEGERDFLAALEARPRFAPALTNLGNLELERGALQEAVARYEAAILADDLYAVAYLNLGVAYRRLGRLGESVRMLRKAQRLEGSWKLRKRG
jgi:tetratricopeptide (TPR) repeat protein